MNSRARTTNLKWRVQEAGETKRQARVTASRYEAVGIRAKVEDEPGGYLSLSDPKAGVQGTVYFLRYLADRPIGRREVEWVLSVSEAIHSIGELTGLHAIVKRWKSRTEARVADAGYSPAEGHRLFAVDGAIALTPFGVASLLGAPNATAELVCEALRLRDENEEAHRAAYENKSNR